MKRDCKWQEQVRLLGLTSRKEEALMLDWSASGAAFRTRAGHVEMELYADDRAEEETAYLSIFIKKNFRPEFQKKKIKLRAGVHSYPVLESDDNREADIFIVKSTEEQYMRVGIIRITADALMTPLPEPKHRILFIGDSLTAGFGVDGTPQSAFTTADEDVTKAYSFLTAQTLGADSLIVASSGNGVCSRWIPPEQDTPVTEGLIPEIFPYARMGNPDLIVCNLGTNDASFTRGVYRREETFIRNYSAFIRKLRLYIPKAEIMLVYGWMEETLSEAVRQVASVCDVWYFRIPPNGISVEPEIMDRAEAGRSLPGGCRETAGIYGSAGHPGVISHRRTAALLADEIRKRMRW